MTVAMEKDALSYSQQKKYADWLSSPKKADTRAERLEKAVGMLADKIKIK